MTLRNKAQSGYYKEYVKHSHEDLTIRQIWERTGELGSLSNAYYVIKSNGLPYKASTPGRKFKLLSETKYFNELKQLDTPNLTIKQIMGKLGLTKTSEYYTVLKTLNANGMPYKRARYLKKQSKHEAQLRGIDTANMTIKEIAKEMGFIHDWQIKKLYALMDKLGLTYKRAK